MLRIFVQVPRDRALKHVNKLCDDKVNPPSHVSHLVRPENKYFGRRARTSPCFAAWRVLACRALTACHEMEPGGGAPCSCGASGTSLRQLRGSRDRFEGR